MTVEGYMIQHSAQKAVPAGAAKAARNRVVSALTMQLGFNAKAQSCKDAKEEGEKMAPRLTITVW
jgi:hypothetical protein